MTYAVKELFYSLQGEGAHSGRPAVFCRFAGCNLWSGRDEDRFKGPGGCSAWCDTDFVGVNGERGGKFSSAEDLANAIERRWPAGSERRFVVCTGGEPLLQLDEALLRELHARGFTVAVETNGTQDCPSAVDWVCVSPKAGGQLRLQRGNELKLVYPQDELDPESFVDLEFERFYLQPMDGPNLRENTALALEYCKLHPRWTLSLQIHKALQIP